MVCGQDVDGDSQFCENTEDLNILKEEKEGKNKGRVGWEMGVSGLFCAPSPWVTSDQSSSVSDPQGEIFSS